jgi:hypothetical protein
MRHRGWHRIAPNRKRAPTIVVISAEDLQGEQWRTEERTNPSSKADTPGPEPDSPGQRIESAERRADEANAWADAALAVAVRTLASWLRRAEAVGGVREVQATGCYH